VAHVPEKGAGDFDDDFAGSGGARVQVHVDPLLAELGKIRERGGVAVDDCFAIMGVTMIDLYSGSTDLFVAGMAAGASNVAVFSFHRYVSARVRVLFVLLRPLLVACKSLQGPRPRRHHYLIIFLLVLLRRRRRLSTRASRWTRANGTITPT